MRYLLSLIPASIIVGLACWFDPEFGPVEWTTWYWLIGSVLLPGGWVWAISSQHTPAPTPPV